MDSHGWAASSMRFAQDRTRQRGIIIDGSVPCGGPWHWESHAWDSSCPSCNNGATVEDRGAKWAPLPPKTTDR